jgi:hypothetical protein
MDPQTCFEYMLDSESRSDWDAYRECQANLIDWLRKGGFGPRVVTADGRKGQLVALTYTGDATVRWANGRRSPMRLHDLGYEVRS